MPLLSMLSFHLLSLLISSSSVLAITAKSSAYSCFNGRAALNFLDMAYMTITNNNGLNGEPWCIRTFIWKNLLLPKTVLTTVSAPLYVDITANTSHSSTPSLSIAQLITSRDPIKSFCQIQKTKTEFLFLKSKILWHLSYNKKWHPWFPYLRKAKLHIIYPNLVDRISE